VFLVSVALDGIGLVGFAARGTLYMDWIGCSYGVSLGVYGVERRILGAQAVGYLFVFRIWICFLPA